MDLIPILSTIVLVATLVTLLFSVTAYVIYKVKERKTNGAVNGHKPVPQVVGQPLHEAQAPVYPRQLSVPELGNPPLTPSPQGAGVAPAYASSQRPSQGPVQERIFQAPQMVGQPRMAPGASQEPGEPQSDIAQQGTGFFIYTPYGYVPVRSNKAERNLRWR